MAVDAEPPAPTEPAEPADAAEPPDAVVPREATDPPDVPTAAGPLDIAEPAAAAGRPDVAKPSDGDEPADAAEPADGAEPADAEPADAEDEDEPFEPDGWRRALWVFVPLVLVVAAVALYLPRHLTRDHLDRARVGDCVRVLSGGGDNPYRIVDCDEESASLRVLERIPRGRAARQQCRDVAGVTRQFSVDGVTACLGEKDVDPAAAVNGAAAGDCLDGRPEARVVECGSEAASYRVVKVLRDVPTATVTAACAEVPDATAAYLWSLAADGVVSGAGSGLTVDLVLCLARATPDR